MNLRSDRRQRIHQLQHITYPVTSHPPRRSDSRTGNPQLCSIFHCDCRRLVHNTLFSPLVTTSPYPCAPMMLRKAFFAVLPWLMLSRSMVTGKEHPLLLFNNTLVIGTAQSESFASADTSCFPALGFEMPTTIPSSLDGWWCDSSTEYAFVGFSYEITQCAPDLSHLHVHRLTFPSIQAKARAN